MLSSPSLQELANQVESGCIWAITHPSLQDLLLCQESGSNSLLLHAILDLTSPSLQDCQICVFGPGPFAEVGYVRHTGGVDPDIFASNPGFVLSNIADSPADPFDIPDHPSSFGAANGFFSHVGNLLCRRIGGSLPGDPEEKDVYNFDLHIGFGIWF